MSEYQDRYWRELDQLKVHVFYLEEYLEKTVSTDRVINIFLAVASSGSITGWVIWKEYQFVWAGIIAVSQLINAIKIFFPYSKRLKSLVAVTNDLEALFVSMEDKWFDVSEGKLTNEEIHRLHIKFKEKKRQITQKHLGASPIPHKNALMEKAKKYTADYFTNFYTIEEKSND